MGKKKNNKAAKGKKAGNGNASSVTTGDQKMSEDALKIAKELVFQESIKPLDAYKQSGALAAALGVSFKGHKPHGSNHSSRDSGKQVIQNVFDGINDLNVLKTHWANEIFQATTFKPE